jgi:hypothetical protein
MTSWKQVAAAILVVAAALAALLLPFRHENAGKHFDQVLEVGDFDAFYCAGRVARLGGDPYKLAPLAACQSEFVDAPGGIPYAQRGIDPAPLPAYDLALFAPFSLFGYRAAGLVWTALLVVALLASAACVRRLCALPFWAAFAMLSTAGGIRCIVYGQEQPLVTLALVSAALLLRSGKTRSAIAVASLCLVEPQVGLPVVLALIVWTRERLTAAAFAAAFALLGLGFGGLALNLEYFTRVLPVHAFAEIADPIQFSFAALLFAAGVASGAALKIASLQYALAIALGVAFAGPLARRAGTPVLVLFPAACAVTGGTYIHIFQISSALPFALYLASSVPEFAALGWIGAALIALPWPAYGYEREDLVLDAFIVAAATLGIFAKRATALAASVGVAAFALYLLSGAAMKRLPGTAFHADPPAAVAAAGYDPSLASTQSAIDVRESPLYNGASAQNLIARCPPWTGLVLVFAAGIGAARRPGRVTSSA